MFAQLVNAHLQRLEPLLQVRQAGNRRICQDQASSSALE